MKGGLYGLPWRYCSKPKQVNKPLSTALESRDEFQIRGTIHIINNARQSCRRTNEWIFSEAFCGMSARTQEVNNAKSAALWRLGLHITPRKASAYQRKRRSQPFPAMRHQYHRS